MKKNIILLIIAAACITSTLSLLFVSCKSNSKYNDKEAFTKDSNKSNSVSIDYLINQETFVVHSNNNNISIKYPQLTSAKSNFSKANQLIMDTIKNYLIDEYGNDYTNLMLNVDYQKTLSNNSFISFIFKGLGNVRTAAHPNNVFFSLNIDLENSTKLRLKDIYIIDSNFVDKVKEKWLKQTPPEVSDYLMEYSDNELTALLINADNSDSGIYSYHTDKQLGISFQVPHAIGDHIGILINNDELNLKK